MHALPFWAQGGVWRWILCWEGRKNAMDITSHSIFPSLQTPEISSNIVLLGSGPYNLRPTGKCEGEIWHWEGIINDMAKAFLILRGVLKVKLSVGREGKEAWLVHAIALCLLSQWWKFPPTLRRSFCWDIVLTFWSLGQFWKIDLMLERRVCWHGCQQSYHLPSIPTLKIYPNIFLFIYLYLTIYLFAFWKLKNINQKSHVVNIVKIYSQSAKLFVDAQNEPLIL